MYSKGFAVIAALLFICAGGFVENHHFGIAVTTAGLGFIACVFFNDALRENL